ncbi:MAG: DNA repair protein RecO [Phycisphaerales bacterium]|nr:DNA repair protein RecO [Phycisphaerales bacterium]
MPAITDRAIVLRLSDYSETSQIATIFTRAHGLVRLIAKGVKRSTSKRVNVGLDLLEGGEIAFVPSKAAAMLGVLTEWRQLTTFSGLRTALSRLYAGLYAAELTSLLNEEYDPHAELFEELEELLRDLDAQQPVEPALASFQLALLGAIGYAPMLEHCIICGHTPRSEPVYFSARAGGVLCRDCEMHQIEKVRMDRRLVGRLAEGRSLTPELSHALRDVLDYQISQILGRRPVVAASLEIALRATGR